MEDEVHAFSQTDTWDGLSLVKGPRPTAPALPQRHSCELRHQVELGRPHVPEGRRERVSRPSATPKWCDTAICVAKSILVEAEMVGGNGEGAGRLAGREPAQVGTSTSITKQPPGSRCAAALRKHATCSSCVVRFSIVLNTRYTSRNVAVDRGVAKSPMVTPIASAPGLARSCATIAGENVDPVDAHAALAERQSNPPGADGELEGVAVPARSARKSTVGPTTAGANISGGAGVVSRGDAVVEVDLCTAQLCRTRR